MHFLKKISTENREPLLKDQSKDFFNKNNLPPFFKSDNN